MAAKKGTEPSSTGRPHVEYTASWREKGSVPFFGVHPCSAETLRVAGKQHGLRAGACAVVITPPEDMQPVFLAGFRPGNRLSEGVHDDLYARALALSDGSTTLVLMALDLIGYTQAESRPLRREISAIPDANIILAATHTHSGPDTIGLWGPSLLESGVDEAYLSWLRERAKEAILGAVEDLAPADLTFGSEALSDGIVKNTRAPDALDREVSVLRAARPDGSTVGTLVNFAAHAEILLHENRLISADFPHYLCQRIEAEVGGTAMFLNGALGGMVTPAVAENTFAEAERIGCAAAETALRALAEGEGVSEAGLSVGREFVHIPPENELLEVGVAMGVIKADLTDEGEFRAEVHYVRIGEHAEMVTLPGEPFPAVGLSLKSDMSAPCKFVVSLANDEIGYMMPAEHWDDELYALERRSCVGPAAAELCEQALRRLMNASSSSLS